jgi:hypothetical protein
MQQGQLHRLSCLCGIHALLIWLTAHSLRQLIAHACSAAGAHLWHAQCCLQPGPALRRLAEKRFHLLLISWGGVQHVILAVKVQEALGVGAGRARVVGVAGLAARGWFGVLVSC